MAARFITQTHVLVEFPAKDGGQIELSNTQTEEYNTPVYLTRVMKIDDDCPPKVRETLEAVGLTDTMVGFVRESDYIREFWLASAYAHCSFQFSMVRI